MATITLNEIPLSFLRDHSYILLVSGINDYRFPYSSKPLPEDFDGSIGDFLDELSENEELKKEYKKFLEQIQRDIISDNKRLCIKESIVDLYEAANCDVPFELFRVHSDFKENDRDCPEIYNNADWDTMSLREVFQRCDADTRRKIGINLAANKQYSTCIKLLVFKNINNADNFTVQLRSFVKCFVEYSKSLFRETHRSVIFSRFFKYIPYNTDTTELKDLASELNMTTSGVGNHLKKAIALCRELMYEGAVDCYFPETFIDRIYDLKKFINSKLPMVKREDLCKFIGSDIDEKTLAFICKLFDIKLYQYKDYDPIYINSNIKSLQLDRIFFSMSDYFSANPIGVTSRQVNTHLSKTDDAYRSIAIRFIEESSCFKSEQVEGETLYFIKWQYLKTTSDRIARILYENNGSMELKQIVEEYNSRVARVQGIDTITTQLKNERPNLIEIVGRTGTWRLKTNTVLQNDGVKSIEELIKEFLKSLSSDTEFAYGSLKEFVLSRVGDVYPDRSIKTTINRLGYVVKTKGEDIYILSDKARWSLVELIKAIAETLFVTTGKTMRRGDLINTLQNNTGRTVNAQTFSVAIETAKDLFKVNDVNSKLKYISLIPETLASVDYSVYQVERDAPEYYKAIKDTAIDELLRGRNKPMLLSDLKSMVEQCVPGDRDSKVIYKIFEREDIFVKSNDTPKKISLNIKLYKELYSSGLSMYTSGKSGAAATSRDFDIEFGFDWDELKQLIIDNVSVAFVGNSKENSEAILDKMYEIMKGSFSELSSNSQFWKTLDLWNRLYKYPTSCYERELLSTKLILGVENYLDSLLHMHGVDDKAEGLYKKITTAQMYGLLPGKDVREHRINKLIGPVIGIRNRYSHTNNERHHDPLSIYDTIDKCMKFYICVAAFDMANRL